MKIAYFIFIFLILIMVFVSGRPESPGSSASPVSPETGSPGSTSWVGGVFRCRSWGSQGFTTAEIGGIVFLVLLFVSLVVMNPLTPFIQYCYEFKTIQESHFCIFIIYWSLLVFPLPCLVMMILDVSGALYDAIVEGWVLRIWETGWISFAFSISLWTLCFLLTLFTSYCIKDMDDKLYFNINVYSIGVAILIPILTMIIVAIYRAAAA